MKSVPQAPSPTTPPGGRAKRERADAARNRARILAAASAAFAENGVYAQMDDVAERAGVAVGTLYRHFATKEALLSAIVDTKFQQILELTRRGVERDDEEAFEVLAAVLRRRIEVVADDALAKAALLAADDTAWAAVGDTVAEIKSTLQTLVDRAQEAGTLRPDVDANDVWTASCGICAVMGEDPEAWRRQLGIVLDGLRRTWPHQVAAVGAG